MDEPTVPACPECGTPVAKVTAEVDPQAIALRHRAACGHLIPGDLARVLWKAHGYRWDLPEVNAAALGVAERLRQFSVEGYTPAHDAAHDPRTLPWAAWCYVDSAVNDPGNEQEGPPMMWPWTEDEWKGDVSPERRLTIAIGLLMAALDVRLREGRLA